MKRGRKPKKGRKKNPEGGLLMGRGLHKKTIELIDFINKHILKDERKSIRRIYYALEARQKITTSSKNYQMIKNAIKMARFHGLINPDQILIDKARQSRTSITETYHAHQVIKALDNMGYWYSINYWDMSDYYIEVWQEKEAMEPEFLPICGKYNIRLETGKGDQSIQVIWAAMKRWNLLLSADKKIVVLYFGDFNPSGIHALTAIQNTITKLNDAWKNKFTCDFSEIEFRRIGLHLSHILKYELPQNPTKQTTHKDKVLAKRFIAKYGDVNVELESLAERNKPALLQMIEEAIKEYVEDDVKIKLEQKKRKIYPRIQKIINTMKEDYFNKGEKKNERKTKSNEKSL